MIQSTNMYIATTVKVDSCSAKGITKANKFIALHLRHVALGNTSTDQTIKVLPWAHQLELSTCIDFACSNVIKV